MLETCCVLDGPCVINNEQLKQVINLLLTTAGVCNGVRDEVFMCFVVL